MPPTFGQAESADYVSSVYQTDDTHREAPADAQTQQFSYAAPSMDAQALGSIGQTAEMYTQSKAHNGKMSRKEKKALKAEQKAQKRELAARQKASRKKSQSLKAQLKQRDKELSDVMCKTVEKRRKANNAVSWLGYNAMYIDGICEVEEGLFSETIAIRGHKLPIHPRRHPKGHLRIPLQAVRPVRRRQPCADERHQHPYPCR